MTRAVRIMAGMWSGCCGSPASSNYADQMSHTFSVFPLLEKELGTRFRPTGAARLMPSLSSTGFARPSPGDIVDRMRRKSAVLGGLFTWSVICSATALSRTLRSTAVLPAQPRVWARLFTSRRQCLSSATTTGSVHARRAMGTHQTERLRRHDRGRIPRRIDRGSSLDGDPRSSYPERVASFSDSC